MSHDDDHDESQPASIWTWTVFLASLPLFYMGNYYVGLCFVLIGLLYCSFGSLTHKMIPEQDQFEIKYNIYSADDVLQDLIAEAQKTTVAGAAQDKQQRILRHPHFRMVVLAALSALVKKYGKLQQQQTKEGTSTTKEQQQQQEITHLSLICQEAVYIILDTFGDDDDAIVAASLALLALVAKCEAVRERHLHQADVYGLNVLIASMNKALQRGKTYSNKRKDQESAELQRKACLMLGALSDGDGDMASQIVSEGGISSILEAASWYRYHKEVANWALWSIFVLCYENSSAKAAVVQQTNGISIILQAMKNCQDSVEVARHGIAIIFDLLREQQTGPSSESAFDVWKVRNAALAAGLHEIVVHAMTEFSGNAANLDIVMMGRELLIGTGYQGPIPEAL